MISGATNLTLVVSGSISNSVVQWVGLPVRTGIIILQPLIRSSLIYPLSVSPPVELTNSILLSALSITYDVSQGFPDNSGNLPVRRLYKNVVLLLDRSSNVMTSVLPVTVVLSIYIVTLLRRSG